MGELWFVPICWYWHACSSALYVSSDFLYIDLFIKVALNEIKWKIFEIYNTL